MPLPPTSGWLRKSWRSFFASCPDMTDLIIRAAGRAGETASAAEIAVKDGVITEFAPSIAGTPGRIDATGALVSPVSSTSTCISMSRPRPLGRINHRPAGSRAGRRNVLLRHAVELRPARAHCGTAPGKTRRGGKKNPSRFPIWGGLCAGPYRPHQRDGRGRSIGSRPPLRQWHRDFPAPTPRPCARG